MRKFRSFLSVLLALCMIVSASALPAFAESNDGTADSGASAAIPAPAPITDIVKEDGTPVKVACIGDSITYGYKIVSTNADTGELENTEYTYPAKLDALLGEGYEVGNFCKSGAYLLADDHELNVKAGQGKSYTDQAEYTASIEYAPDVVIIMLGTNDIRSMVTPEANEAVKDALVALVDAYQALESVKRVYVASSIYTQVDNACKPVADGTLQAVQLEAAIESGAEFLDVFSPTRDYFDVMLHRSDRLHPIIECSDAIPDTVYALLTGDENYVAPEAPVAESGVVYVNSSTGNFTNDALSPEAPTNSLPYAAGLVRNGGVIVICGVYNLYNATQGTHMPDTDGEIVITSLYGGTDYGAAGAKINMNSGYLYLGGDTVFENIKLASTSSSMIMCNYHNVTFEDTVTCAATSGVQNPIIVAGYNVTNGGMTEEQASFDGNCTITVNGGTWHYMRNGNRRASSASTMGAVKEGASVNFIINGGVFQSTDYQNNNAATGMNNVYGDCSLTINGGSFPGRVYAVNRVGDIADGSEGVVTGKVTLAINGGMVRGNVMALHYTGTNVNIDDADIRLVLGTRYADSTIFEGFENVTVVDNDIVLDSAEDIIALMSDPDAWDGYYVLADNIDLTDAGTQHPIGNDDVRFSGYFDGAGHTISGVNITDSKSAGFFGVVNGAEIMNLTVDGSVKSTYAAAHAETSASIGYVATGLLVGKILSNTDVSNCKAYGSTEGNGNVAGMIGMIYHIGEGTVRVDFCDNYAVPTNPLGNTGGLISYITPKALMINSTFVVDCNNYADVSSVSTDRCRVAGIVAFVTSLDKLVILRCSNYGDISGNNALTSTHAPYVGGIGGRLEAGGADAVLEIRDCYNYGTVYSTYMGGGMVAYIHHVAAATGHSTVTGCVNNGDVTVGGTNKCIKYSGGIVGLVNNPTYFENCINNAKVKSDTTVTNTVYAAGILGMSNSAFAANGYIKNSVNTGEITVVGGKTICAGGIIGEQLRVDLENCYNSGNIVGATATFLGAISGVDKAAGSYTDTNCYALEGSATKLVGTARDAYCEKTNVAFVSADATALKDSYAGFDFTDTWTIKDGAPALDHFTAEATGDIDADGTVTNADITLAVRHLSGWDIEYRADRFELTGDGKLNNRDVIALILAIAQ